MQEIFPNVFRDGRELYTLNLAPGKKVYNERLKKVGKDEYRSWDPNRSKLGAALANGLKMMPIKPHSKILYLGASTGTTISHVSDIIRAEGIVYGLEFAERVFRNLLDVAATRQNIAPILGDARKPEQYAWVEECDVIFCDIADPQETEVMLRNAIEFLKKGGYVMISVKSQSIDVTKAPEQVFKEESKKLSESGFEIVEQVSLEPFESKHAMIIARKK